MKEEEGDQIQKVGAGCAESDRTEALGCQRIMWAVHTESTNNAELGLVLEGSGQQIARVG